MTAELPRILIVDDEEIALDLLESVLAEKFITERAECGQTCLDKFQQQSFDIVLLDVNLPDINGLDICQQLSEINASTPVIFISAKDTEAERLAGYQAGAYDYIVKPVVAGELLAKLERVLNQQSAKTQLAQQNQELSSAVMDSIMGAGELGLVIQFAIAVLDINSHQQLAAQLNDTLKQIANLESVIFIGSETDDLFQTEGKPSSPMEINVVAMLREKGRIFEIDGKVQINEARASVLIKNMPDDPMLRGRVMDHIPLLLQITSKRSENIDTAVRLIESDQLLEIVEMAVDRLHNAEDVIREKIADIVSIADGQFDAIVNDVHRMMLTEEHEQHLVSSIKEAGEMAHNSADQAIEVCSDFGDIIKDLNKLV